MQAKVVLVTGDSRGIGLETVKLLLSNTSMIVVGISRAQRVDLDIPQFMHLQMDLSLEIEFEKINTAILDFIKEKGFSTYSVYGLVHNAGLLNINKINNTTRSSWLDSFSVNLLSGVELSRFAIEKSANRDPRIIFVSSGAATSAYELWSEYCCSKAAVNMFVECLVKENPSVFAIAYRPGNINVILGVVDTEMQSQIRREALEKGMPLQLYSRFKNLHESNSLIKPIVPATRILQLLTEPIDQSINGHFIYFLLLTFK